VGKKRLVLSDKLPPMRRGMTYSHAIKVGNTIYVAGQVARDKEYRICHKRDFLGQIEMVFQNIKDVLEVAGATMQDVVKLNFFCRHLWDLRLMGPAFEKYFGDHVPAMTAVEVVQLEDQVIIDGKEKKGVSYGKPYKVPGEAFRFDSD